MTKSLRIHPATLPQFGGSQFQAYVRRSAMYLHVVAVSGGCRGVPGRCRKVKYCQAVQNLFPLPLVHWCANTKIQNILLLVRSAGNYRCYVVDPRFSAM